MGILQKKLKNRLLIQKIGQTKAFLRKKQYLCSQDANITQLVERNLPKVEVAGSSPVVRSSMKGTVSKFWRSPFSLL